jgi:hypothetical protein
MSQDEQQQQVLVNVLNITRDQLNRSMSLNAELEALLTIEREKNAALEAQVAQLTAAPKEDSAKK